MKRKMILFAALVAASSTAITSCSSNDDDVLSQAPVAPVAEETVVDTPKGTPFSISVSGDTRATLYGTDGWTAANSTSSKWIKDIKIYGIQQSDDPVVNNNWMKSNVFTRASYDTDTWTTSRDAESTSAETPTWPTTNTSVATTFYAITDNAIGEGKDALISNVGSWMSTVGKFNYTMALDKNVKIPHIDPTSAQTGTNVDGGVETDLVKVDDLNDLMVANATKTESETASGQLSLTFSHVLAGLNIKAIFLNNQVKEGYDAYVSDPDGNAENTGNFLIHYIKIMGLKTGGTYTFNPSGEDPNWNTSAGDYACYYKAFNPPIEVKAFAEAVYPQNATAAQKAEADKDAIEAADENKWLVAKNDPWMVIPQQTNPWNCQGCGSNEYIADGMAYIVLGITDHVETPNVEIFLPLDTKFVAGKNKTLRLDLSKFRDLYQNTNLPGEAAYYVEPANATGSGARGYDFIDE